MMLAEPPSVYPCCFVQEELGCEVLAYSFDSLLLSDVVVWWWLSVNAFCSRVVLCWYILPNMPVFEYCFLSPESSIIESYLFTMSFVRLISLVLLVHVRRSFGL